MTKELLIKEQGQDAYEFITAHSGNDLKGSLILKTDNVFNLESLSEKNYASIVNFTKVNDIKEINRFFRTVNGELPEDGIFIGCVETYTQRKKRLLHKFPLIIAQIYFFLDFIFKRLFPKLLITRKLYFFLTAGRNSVLSKAEALGRLVFNGFDIVEIKEIGYLTYFCCKKTTRPIPEKKPSVGILFKMRRVGKNNKSITVYKIRTMHPYAEYIQSYIFENNSLREGGKIKNDYRITSWGKIFRKCFIDEIPMIINVLKGELKLVGVRPLSEHYLSLYSNELKQKRINSEPGLIPPFYADLPKTLNDIMNSELKYINLFETRPLETDIKYFFVTMKNILFKRARTY